MMNEPKKVRRNLFDDVNDPVKSTFIDPEDAVGCLEEPFYYEDEDRRDE